MLTLPLVIVVTLVAFVVIFYFFLLLWTHLPLVFVTLSERASFTPPELRSEFYFIRVRVPRVSIQIYRNLHLFPALRAHCPLFVDFAYDFITCTIFISFWKCQPFWARCALTRCSFDAFIACRLHFTPGKCQLVNKQQTKKLMEMYKITKCKLYSYQFMHTSGVELSKCLRVVKAHILLFAVPNVFLYSLNLTYVPFCLIQHMKIGGSWVCSPMSPIS